MQLHTKKRRMTVLAGGVGLIAALTCACSIGACGVMGADSSPTNDNNNNNSSSCVYFVGVSPLTPEVGDLVTLDVSSSGWCNPATYSWSATDPDDIDVTLTVRNPPRTAEFTPEKAGGYTVTVIVFDSSVDGDIPVVRSFTVTDPEGEQRTYLLRFSPPTGLGMPRQQAVITVTGFTPMTNQVYSLEPGMSVSNTLYGPGGPFSAYLRLIQSGFPLYRELHVGSTGEFSVQMLADMTYDVMVIPDDPIPAPALLSNQTVLDLQDSAAFQLDQGVFVTGYVLDASGLPIADAQVGLRSGALPSGIGTADWFTGGFSLAARPGEQGLEISPPEGSGLPRVRVPEGPSLVVDEQTALGLAFEYADLSVSTVELRVMAGTTPVGDARVTLSSSALEDVGTLTVTRDGSEVAVIDAEGSFRVTATTDQDGLLPQLSVPAGTYRVVIEVGGDVPAGFGTTLLEPFVVAGTGPIVQDAALAAPASLEGQVLDASGLAVADLRVVAVTTLGVGSAAEVTTDASGFFSLPVVGGASYTVMVMPEPASELGRLRLVDVVVDSPVTTLWGEGPGGALVVPRGLQLSGRVMLQNGPVPGVLVQAIPSGVEGEPVLAEAVTDGAGEFSLVLPDPGGS